MKRYLLSLVAVTCLMLLLASQAFAAGGSIKDAEAVTFGSAYSGTISETNNVDYYEFTLPSSGRVSLSATGSLQWLYYHIYDSSGAQLLKINSRWDSALELLVTKEAFDLTKGTYYLAVGSYMSDTENYSLTLGFESAGESFTETGDGTDNALNAANSVQLDQTYYGQLAINDERDFYTFTLPSSGRIAFSATARMQWVYYAFYDADGEQIWRQNPTWDSTTESIVTREDINLLKGSYYLVVSRYGMNTGDYTVNLQFSSANESFEESKSSSDNSMASANRISLNQSYVGHIALNDEKDFYQFTVPSSGEVRLVATAYMQWIRYYIYKSSFADWCS